MITCLQKIIELHGLCNFQTTEGSRVGPASKSELRRWFQQKCIEINCVFPNHDDPCPPYIARLVLFPKNPKKRCTLFWDDNVTITIDELIYNRVKQEIATEAV